eukprot:11387005-Alexandrium_andersonii.AAC.1
MPEGPSGPTQLTSQQQAPNAEQQNTHDAQATRGGGCDPPASPHHPRGDYPPHPGALEAQERSELAVAVMGLGAS